MLEDHLGRKCWALAPVVCMNEMGRLCLKQTKLRQSQEAVNAFHCVTGTKAISAVVLNL